MGLDIFLHCFTFLHAGCDSLNWFYTLETGKCDFHLSTSQVGGTLQRPRRQVELADVIQPRRIINTMGVSSRVQTDL